MLFRARRATLETMMNFCCVFFLKKTCVRDRFNLESTFSCLVGESYIYEHDFLFFFPAPNARRSHEHYEVGRYCEISCKVRACSHSAVVNPSIWIHMKKKRKEMKKTV